MELSNHTPSAPPSRFVQDNKINYDGMQIPMLASARSFSDLLCIQIT